MSGRGNSESVGGDAQKQPLHFLSFTIGIKGMGWEFNIGV